MKGKKLEFIQFRSICVVYVGVWVCLFVCVRACYAIRMPMWNYPVITVLMVEM